VNKSGLASRWIPAILIMAIIFLASSTPASQLPNAGQWDLLLKKGGHFTGYALLALGLIRAQGKGGRTQYLLAIIGCGLFALTDEFHQSFVDGRNPALADVGIDLAGALAASFIYSQVRFVRNFTLKYLSPD